MAPATVIAVVGAGDAPADVRDLAFQVGCAIGRRGAVLVCGGRGGVMEAAARGARSAGGHTLGILPGYERNMANPHIEFAIATGMGQARNVIVVATADAVIALGGEGGTLSEIGLAIKLGRPVVALGSWNEIAGRMAGITYTDNAGAAVELAMELAQRSMPAGTKS
jgi:uncharacterized protein (TIGR00725 family)